MGRPRHTISVPALAAVLMLGVGGAAQAACYASGQQLPAQEVSRFINDPERLLTRFPDGGPQMISLIRDLVASETGSLPLVINLNVKANAEQIEAIGTGLGQAALVCNRTAQAFASQIQLLTVTADNPSLSQAFSAVMGNLFLSSSAPDGGGGGGGGSAATSGPLESAPVGGGTLNLPTSIRTSSTKSPAPGPFTPGTSGDPGSLFPFGTPGSGPDVISSPNTSSRYVSPSRP
jgi:hypothetical protein